MLTRCAADARQGWADASRLCRMTPVAVLFCGCVASPARKECTGESSSAQAHRGRIRVRSWVLVWCLSKRRPLTAIPLPQHSLAASQPVGVPPCRASLALPPLPPLG
jgi:hypothetical protein